MFDMSVLLLTGPTETLYELSASPLLPPVVVGSPEPHAVVSPDSGSTRKIDEMIAGSPVAVAVREGASGGVFAAVQRPPLNRPPVPDSLTTVPAGHGTTRVVEGPGFPQSTEAPLLRIEPSMASQPDGAASTCTDVVQTMPAASVARTNLKARWC